MKDKIIWFVGGFGIGLTMLSLGHAAIQKRATPTTAPVSSTGKAPQQSGSLLSEMKENKVAAPEPEQDYSNLANLESRYAESAAQQDRLRAATARAAGKSLPARRRQ